MTTKEAFEQLISKRAWYKGFDITPNTASSLKHNHRKGLVTIEKMEEILLKTGHVVAVEKQWKLKK